MNYYRQEISRLRGLLKTERRRARTDVLTGLRNRRCFEEALAGAVADRVTLGVILFDAANLHAANLLRGHDGGDALIQRIVAGIREVDDHAYRIGGDEFAVLLTGVSGVEDVEKVRDRIETSIGRIRLGETVSMFLTGGCAVHCPDGDVKQTLRQADLACAARKHRIKKQHGEALTRQQAEHSLTHTHERMSERSLDAPRRGEK